MSQYSKAKALAYEYFEIWAHKYFQDTRFLAYLFLTIPDFLEYWISVTVSVVDISQGMWSRTKQTSPEHVKYIPNMFPVEPVRQSREIHGFSTNSERIT